MSTVKALKGETQISLKEILENMGEQVEALKKETQIFPKDLQEITNIQLKYIQ